MTDSKRLPVVSDERIKLVRDRANDRAQKLRNLTQDGWPDQPATQQRHEDTETICEELLSLRAAQQSCEVQAEMIAQLRGYGEDMVKERDAARAAHSKLLGAVREARQCLGDTAQVMESWSQETDSEPEQKLRMSYAAQLRALSTLSVTG